MRERPILFSAPMVRAILDGRKTQTRRMLKVQPAPHDGWDWSWPQPRGTPGTRICWRDDVRNPNLFPYCPYGVPGDLLWVRETWSAEWSWRNEKPRDIIPCAPIWYWADGDPTDRDWTRPKPSIHMPRWASRITLRITDVRVERLNDISEADAQEEGASGGCLHCGTEGPRCCDFPEPSYRDGFAYIWQTINGEASWHANPWVWAVSFERVQP